MPKSIISEGKTTNEAIENGLKKLGVSKNAVDIKVLQEEKRSFFSILDPRVVKIELTVKDEKVNSVIREKKIVDLSDEELDKSANNVELFMNDFVKTISDETTFSIEKLDKQGISVIIKGNNVGFLIGHRGSTLYSLQNIVNSIANKGIEKKVLARLDIEGYKESRIKKLEELAEKMANTVVKTRKSITLEPMKAYERKIIHSKLQDNDKVTTKSIGEEPRRRVVITLK